MSADAKLTWSLQPPCGEGLPEWLAHCRALRSRVLYDDGRRPQFGPGGSAELDPDPLDLDSYHWNVADAEERLVATLRMTLLGRAGGVVEGLLGAERFAALLGELGARREQVCEFSRWVVDPAWRGRGLAVELVRSGLAQARRRGVRWALGAAGRLGAQVLTHKCGMTVLAGLADIPVPLYADCVSVVAIDLEGRGGAASGRG